MHAAIGATVYGRRLAGGIPFAANLAIWLKKGTQTTTDWPDSSANGRTMTLTNGPTPINGDGAIRLGFHSPDGNIKHLSSTFTLAQPCTAFARLKPAAGIVNDNAFCDGIAGASMLMQSQAGPAMNIYATGSVGVLNLAYTAEAYNTFISVFNGANSYNHVNGTEAGPGNPGAASPGGVRVGTASWDLGRGATADWLEFGVYNFALDASQRAALAAYLNAL